MYEKITVINLLTFPETYVVGFCGMLLIVFGLIHEKDKYFTWTLLGLLLGSIISLIISVIRLEILL